jgi:hypothetical protein
VSTYANSADQGQPQFSDNGDKSPATNRDDAEIFLAALDPAATFFTFQTFDGNTERKDKQLTRILHGTLGARWDELADLNRRGAGIFVTVNETDGDGRSASNIKRVRALFIDLDAGRPLPDAFHVKPHIVIESSPGKWHCYWLMTNCDRTQFESLQKRLIRNYESDKSVHDLPRVMRLPGFVHQKVDKHGRASVASVTRVAEAHDHPAYTVEDFVEGLPDNGNGAAGANEGKGAGETNKSNGAAEPNGFEQYANSHSKSGKPDWSLKEDLKLRTALAAIPPDEKILTEKFGDSHEVFVNIGRALERLGWGDRGKAIWRDWCIGCPGKFDEKGLDLQWKSFGQNRDKADKPITVGTIFHYAKQFAKKNEEPTATFTPRPYVSTDPKLLPRRDWLYRPFLIRKFLSVDVAPGGLGKSNQSLVELCAMASGKPLLGVAPRSRLKIWYWNLEDPPDEIEKRIAAIRIHYNLKPEDLDGWVFVNHGRETPIVIGEADRNGTRIIKPVVDALIAAIQQSNIDVVIVDPFVSTHRVNENDNVAIDMVAKEWSGIADAGNCGVRLTHHTRKGDAEVTSDSGRGASSTNNAARIVRVMNRMTREEADQVGIEGEDRRRYYRTYIDKQNMAPPAEKSDWFFLESVNLENEPNPVNPYDRGDSVGVAVPWQWPEDVAQVDDDDLSACLTAIKTGRWRADSRSPEWVGNIIAKVLGLDLKRNAHRSRVNAILDKWMTAGALQVVDGEDAHRKTRAYVEVVQK